MSTSLKAFWNICFDIYIYDKIMFLHLSVILFTGEVYPSMHWADPPGKHPRADTPPGRQPLQRTVRIPLEYIFVWVFCSNILNVEAKHCELKCCTIKKKTKCCFIYLRYKISSQKMHQIKKKRSLRNKLHYFPKQQLNDQWLFL